MSMEKPLIQLFNTIKGFYVFDINTNTILKVDKAIYNDLKSYLNGEKEAVIDEVKILKKNGYLLPKREFEMIHPMDETLEDNLTRKLSAMTLQLTQNCNLRCKYCVYSGSYVNRVHTNKRMSQEVAFKAIDFLINNSIDSSIIYFGFYGGEPLLEFELIKKCVEYLRKRTIGKKLMFNITTNATLFSPEIIEFLYENKVNVTISLDGSKEMHDNNRVFASNGCGTFGKVMENIELIKNKYPEFVSMINFNTVLDPNNDFSCVNDFFSNYEDIKDFYVGTSLLNENSRKDEIQYSQEYIIRHGYEIFKMFLWKLNKLDEKNVSKLVIQYDAQLTSDIHNRVTGVSADLKKDCPSGQCVPGAQRLFVDVDGNLYPCERVCETSNIMKIGTIENGFDYERVRKILNIAKITEKQCSECWAFRFCSSCAAFADGINDLSSELRLSNCKKVKDYTENMLKDYCALRELGYDFNEEKLGIISV